jgi:hypothetical protein
VSYHSHASLFFQLRLFPKDRSPLIPAFTDRNLAGGGNEELHSPSGELSLEKSIAQEWQTFLRRHGLVEHPD